MESILPSESFTIEESLSVSVYGNEGISTITSSPIAENIPATEIFISFEDLNKKYDNLIENEISSTTESSAITGTVPKTKSFAYIEETNENEVSNENTSQRDWTTTSESSTITAGIIEESQNEILNFKISNWKYIWKKLNDDNNKWWYNKGKSK